MPKRNIKITMIFSNYNDYDWIPINDVDEEFIFKFIPNIHINVDGNNYAVHDDGNEISITNDILYRTLTRKVNSISIDDDSVIRVYWDLFPIRYYEDMHKKLRQDTRYKEFDLYHLYRPSSKEYYRSIVDCVYMYKKKRVYHTICIYVEYI